MTLVALLSPSSRVRHKECLRCRRRIRSVQAWYCRSCRWTWALTS